MQPRGVNRLRAAFVRLKSRMEGSAYLLPRLSETVREARPFARRRASTLRPFAVAILSRKPCLLTLLRLEGWNVLFIACIFYFDYLQVFSERKFKNYFLFEQVFPSIFHYLMVFNAIILFSREKMPTFAPLSRMWRNW